MRKYMLLAALLSLFVSAGYAYSVEVNAVADFPTSFKQVAMLPATTPAGVDSIWVETLLQEKLARKAVLVMPASMVKKAMFDLEIQQIDDEGRKRLADKLGVDAFIAAAVLTSDKETGGATGVVVGAVFVAVPAEKNTTSVQFVIISAETGKALLRGVGYGESEMRSKRGVIGKTFDEILLKAFPSSFFKARQPSK